MKETKLRIHRWGEKILRRRCRTVSLVDDTIRAYLQEMYLLMKVANGVGLAATQAGLDIRLIVVETGGKIFKLINPKIIKKEGLIEFQEGCLSFPGINLTIKRFERIWVSALNEHGEPVDIEADGVLSVIFQHEIDHINGIVFIDRVPFWTRVKLRKHLNKIKSKGGRHGV